MSSLREQIKDNHNIAEKTKFTELLLSGNISKKIYADYLFNQEQCYNVLETLAKEKNILENFITISRTKLIQEDLAELNEKNLTVYPSTQSYINYLTQNNLDKDSIVAHMYVRHFGDMYGGQIIKTKIPSLGRMYEFDNKKELISNFRSILKDSMGDEANRCFNFVIQLHNEISNEYNL